MNQISIQSRVTQKISQQIGKTSSLRGLMALACLVCAGVFSGNASAADPAVDAAKAKTQSPIAINLKQYKVVKDEQGATQYLEAALVVPGDVIEYRAIYSNRSSSVLPVVATMPIPEAMEYVKESAKAKTNIGHTVAARDSQYANEPLVQKVTTASGVTLSQPLPYASYRFVRWDLGRLSPGSSVEVSVRAKVSQDLDKDAVAADKTPVQVSSSTNKQQPQN